MKLRRVALILTMTIATFIIASIFNYSYAATNIDFNIKKQLIIT